MARSLVSSICACVLLGASPGCESTKQAYRASHITAVRYDVEPAIIAEKTKDIDGIAGQDFERIASLGFETVVLHHLDAGDRLPVLKQAEEKKLHAVAGETSGKSTEPPAGNRQDQPISSPGPSITYPLGLPVEDLIVINVGSEAMASRSTIEDWLRQYHDGLVSGRTGGILVDRYQRLPGEPPGLVLETSAMPVSRAAALTALVTRARRWGPLLQGLIATPIPSPGGQENSVSIHVFSGSNNLYVLLYNHSRHNFVHHPIEFEIPPEFGSRARAVEVPVEGDRRVGNVLPIRDRKLTLPANLRPADAVLYQVF